MRVVLLGGAGYVGSVICATLVRRGHDVVVVDDLIYRRTEQPAASLPAGARLVRGDFRDETVLESALAGAEIVVYLGGLVGEPACAVNEDLSVELNYSAAVLAAEVAAAGAVSRFVFLSTCSVYGRQEGVVTEETEPNPLSCYAWTKLRAERRVAEALAGKVELTVFRLATVFGLSPRMRLDSVVNSMASRAATTGSIPLRGGSAWRPLVYVGDVAECTRRVVEGVVPADISHPLVLNVGSDDNNYTIAQIARTVADRVPGSTVVVEPVVSDPRDYRVSFGRIAAVLPDACATAITVGVDEIRHAVDQGEFADPTAIEFDNLRGLRAALAKERVRVLGTGAMARLKKDYDTVETPSVAALAGEYDESAAARYWSEVRLSGVRGGDLAVEDDAVLSQGRPSATNDAYAGWELDCLDAMLPDLTQREVVDLGCGVGRLLPVLAGRAARVVGVDFAPGMVARARARASNLSNVTVVQGSVADVPMPPESVDMVVCLGVFEHISATHRERALHEVARLLRPGGRLLLELNNAGSVLLAGSADDNPYRVGAQLSNGYFCELIEVSAVLNTAETAGFTVLDLTANPFFSTVRHNAAAGDGPHLAELYGHARGLDRALGRSTALRSLADQVIVLLEKQ